MFGGRGGVLGTLVRALIVGVFRKGLPLAGVQVVWQGFAIGLLVLVAVSIDADHGRLTRGAGRPPF